MNVDFSKQHQDWLIAEWSICTYPQLNLVSSWCGKLYTEVWRIVKGTSRTSSVAATSRPKTITRICATTEIVLSHFRDR